MISRTARLDPATQRLILALASVLAPCWAVHARPLAQEIESDGSAERLVHPALERPSPAEYPKELADTRVEGSVELELLVSATGSVDEVVVIESVHPALASAAVKAAQSLRFRPATQNGEAIPVRLRYTYHFVAPASPTRKALLSGTIRSRGNKDPIAGGALLEGGTLLGETGVDGRFELALEPGEHSLEVRAVGHHPLTVTEVVVEGQRTEVLYRLEPLVANPYETVVRAERTELSRHSLHDEELREVPGTMGDAFRVVMLLPGVATIASGLSYPVVRGSQPAATGYFVDGVRVPGLFHLLAGPAIVHPEFLERLDFYPGVPPARFGRFLGGFVDAQPRESDDGRLRAVATVDLINAGGFLETTLPGGTTKVSVSGRASYTAWLFAALASRPDTPRLVSDFADYQARITHAQWGGTFRFLAFGSYDAAGNDAEGINDPDGRPAADGLIKQVFHRVDLRYERAIGPGELSVAATWGQDSLGLSSSRGDVVLGRYSLEADILGARTSYAANLGAVHLTLGADVEQRLSRTDLAVTAEFVDQVAGLSAFSKSEAWATLSGAWSEAVWRVSERWTVTGGARVDSHHLRPGITRLSFDPRVTARYTPVDSLVVKAGAGWLHQAPTVLINVPAIDVAGLRYGLQESLQVSGGFEWAPNTWLDISVDAYFTDLRRTHEFELLDVLQQQTGDGQVGQDVAGRGRAYGIEVMLRHPLGGGWFGWLSYSLQRSERLSSFVDLERYEAEGVIAFKTAYLPFAFDQTHTLNLALSWQLPGRWTVGGVLHLNSGRPESGAISSRTMRVASTATGERWKAVSRDRVDRLPPFIRVDLRASRTWIHDDFTVEAYLDVLNASFSHEVLGYEYERPRPGDEGGLTKRAHAIPLIVPMLGVKGAY